MVTTRSTSSQPDTSNTNTTQPPPANPLPNFQTNPSLDPITHQLSSIVSWLETHDTLAAEIAALKAQSGNIPPPDTSLGNSDKGKTKEINLGPRDRGRNSWSGDEDEVDIPWWIKNPTRRPHTKMEVPKFEGGDPRGWILKAEKYFRYYQTLDNHKVDVAAMYLEGDALDLFAWINIE